MNEKNKKHIVYSCSGCSSAAQMANYIAVKMDRSGIAEMSCIAGVGGDVKPLVNKAKSGQKIIAIDGCPLSCVKSTLSRHNITPDRYYLLNQYGVSKIQHADFEIDEAESMLEKIKDDLLYKKVADIELELIK